MPWRVDSAAQVQAGTPRGSLVVVVDELDDVPVHNYIEQVHRGAEQPRHNCLRLAQNRGVWKAIGARGDDGRLISMPTYKNPNGYEVGPDDRFKLVATYDNPTAERVDAMAGIFVFYSAAP